MDPFPLLKLPQLAQKLIINQVHLVAAIELSMVSKKFERVLQQNKITVDRFEYSFKTDNFSLIIETPSTGWMIIEPTFTESDSTNIWNIDGNNLDIIKEMKDFSRYSRVIVKNKKNTKETKMKTLEKITGYLLKFLRVKKFELSIKRNIDVLNLFIWKYTTSFDRVVLHNQYIDSVIVTPEKLKLFLETLTINHLVLNIQINYDPHFKYLPQNQSISKIRKINIITSDWLEHDSLLNMAQESIVCQISTGFSGKANAILKKWISGENETLEELTLYASGVHNKCDQEQLLMGIKSIPSVFELSEIKERASFCESSIIKDIRREHDGCQATVIISDKNMKMLVWNEKYLKKVGRM